MPKLVEVEKSKLNKLVNCFNAVADLCDELDIYEHEELDKDLQKMKAWVEENFPEK